MRSRLLLILPLLSASALAACSVQETTTDRTMGAYTSDDAVTTTTLDGTCASIADTGDMYRYCMQYGPQQALAEGRSGTSL